MSLTAAMDTGVSGLLANGEAISVIGNNLANLNTVGFKVGRTVFSDLLSSQISNGQVGRGTQIQAAQNSFTQGSLLNTGNSTDVAIEGDGMFVLQDPVSQARFYSRAGSFSFDKDNYLTNPDGYQVVGFGIANGTSNGVLGPVSLANYTKAAPNATTAVSYSLNLDAAATAFTDTWDPTATGFNPVTESNFSVSTPLYDAEGGDANQLTLYFRKTGTDSWNVYAHDGTGYHAAVPVTFNSTTGQLSSSSTLTAGAVTVNLAGTTQYAATSAINSQSQNGYGAGTLVKVSVDDNGYVNALYTNSKTQKVAQLAIARFPSLQGLDKEGGSLYSETVDSGTAIIDPSNLSSNKIASNSLEQSNVDMADQLVQMITTQRAYTANSKTITASDQLLQDTLNIIR